MKRFCTCIVLIVLMFFPFVISAEEGYSDDFRDSVQTDDSLLSDDTDLNNPGDVMEDLSFERFWTYLLRQFKSSFGETIETLVKGIALVLLSVLVSRCCGNIQNQNLQMLFSFMVSLSIVLMCQGNLHNAAESLKKSIEDMRVFTSACIPSFTVVMIAAGEAGSATVFSAAMVLLGEIGTLISENLLLPLTDVYLAVGICSVVSDEYNFMVIGKNIRRFLIWCTGLLVVGFKTVLKLQSGATAATDQLTKKYIKTAVGSLIPMVGNTLSQGVDGLFSVASGVKTSFAIGGVLITLSILLPSLINIGVHGLIWGFCRWIAEFMNDSTVRSIADVLANSFYLMLALGGCVALLGLFSFFGLITQVG